MDDKQVYDHHPGVLVAHIDRFAKDLSEWEKGFIINLVDHPPKSYSEKQIAIIHRIYDEKC